MSKHAKNRSCNKQKTYPFQIYMCLLHRLHSILELTSEFQAWGWDTSHLATLKKNNVNLTSYVHSFTSSFPWTAKIKFCTNWNPSTHILQLGSNTQPLFMLEYFGIPALPLPSEIPLATVVNAAWGDHLNLFEYFCTR